MNRIAQYLFAAGMAWLFVAVPALAQPAPDADAAALRKKLAALEKGVADLRGKAKDESAHIDPRHLADVAVCAKAADWILRHEEFYKPDYIKQTHRVLDEGQRRAKQLLGGQADWLDKSGTVILGYESKVDGSVQPYALTLPEGVNPQDAKRWPLHVVLHGRGDQMNEVNFIGRHSGKAAPAGQDWIQLEPFGRGNNGWRWAGEADVFEALNDVKRRFRIDERRITLHGFSMGGAGAWHLGLHYPGLWSSVGAGAGFVDTHHYLNIAEPLPEYQEKTLTIYDAERYALNAFDVPVVTYGGEQDKQLAASKTMIAAAKEVGVEITFILGKGVGHKFTPEGLREFMAFHRKHSQQGRPVFPGLSKIRFITYTPKYNHCDWLTIEEMNRQYEPATVEGGVDTEGTLVLATKNTAVVQVARDVASDVRIDGTLLPLAGAADGRLPGVYYERGRNGWRVLGYDQSRRLTDNPHLYKRHDVQGPIDDAFMQPFVCVLPTGTPWNADHAAWADWTYRRFADEFDKWMRGRVPTVKDTEVNAKLSADRSLILFGDPGSNGTIAEIIGKLPVKWTKEAIEVGGQRYDLKDHGLSLIFPNPLNPRRYVVINSGHTFHEKEFRGSNAQLYPRLGDIAVQKFARQGDGYKETVEWAALFNSAWRLPED